jgi:hypothetical protein
MANFGDASSRNKSESPIAGVCMVLDFHYLHALPAQRWQPAAESKNGPD